MNPDPGSSVGAQLILIVVLTIINAFFAATEVSLISLNHGRVKKAAENGSKTAQMILKLLQNSNNFLATIQLVITLAGFLSSASAATSLATYVEPIFGNFSGRHEAAVILVTIILSFFSLVIGELYPKQLALRNPNGMAKVAAWPMEITSKILKPFVWLLSASTSLLLKLTPWGKADDSEQMMTREEMIELIETGFDQGTIEKDESEMLEGIISLNHTMAREVMIPRIDAFMVDINCPAAENIDAILHNRYSRIPVYAGDRDHVIGIIHIRNLLRAAREKGFNHVKIAEVMQEPFFTPETIAVDELLLKMRQRQQQMAILLDEYGGIVGIVTLEDLIEEIVGEIDDESDLPHESDVQEIHKGEYLLQGNMLLNDFNEAFETDLKANDVDTIAGYMLERSGRIPTKHAPLRIEINPDLELISGQMQGARMLTVIAKTKKPIHHPAD